MFSIYKDKSPFLLKCVIFLLTLPIYSSPLLYKYGFLYSYSGIKPCRIPYHFTQISRNLWVDRSQRVVASDDHSVTLIGAAINIFDPLLDQREIANNLSSNLKKSEKSFFQYESQLCGRYACIYTNLDGRNYIITDATSMFPVFYDQQALLLASHAHLLAENIYGRKIDFTRKQFALNIVPYNQTPFKDVFQLIPNHVLELSCGRKRRFFPQGTRQSIRKNDALDFLIFAVGNAIKGISFLEKKPLLLALTAGYDSRTTLAVMLQNDLVPDVCYTYLKHKDHVDCTEAVKISRQLGINHIYIDPNYKPLITENDFLDALKVNTHFDWFGLPDNYVVNMKKKFGDRQYLNINSNHPEIWRFFVGSNRNPVPMKMIDQYFNSTNLVREELYDFPKDILYFIEQWTSPWLNFHWIKTDIVFDTFNPYNSRSIIEHMTRIPLDYRGGQEIHEDLIRILYENSL